MSPELTLAALATAALLALALLAIPVELYCRWPGDASRHSRLEVAWLFGRLRWEPRTDRRRPTAHRGRRRLPATAWLRVWQAGLGRPTARLLRSLRRWVRVREMHVRARVGLDDPADTGELLGWVTPLTFVASRALPGLDLELEPAFEGAVLEGGFAGALRIVPLGALAAIVLFALSPATLRAARVVWRSMH